jgi:hypothetical protein
VCLDCRIINPTSSGAVPGSRKSVPLQVAARNLNSCKA